MSFGQKVMKILAWSPSKFAKWKECPAKSKYEDVLKLCPVCFRGKVSGGFDGAPVRCDTCSEPQPEREALDRGNAFDAALEEIVSDKKTKVPGEYAIYRPEEEQVHAAAVRHPKILALVKKLRKAKGVFTQPLLTVARDWSIRKEDPARKVFARDAWGRVKLDVLQVSGAKAEVIDWKTGNIDRNKLEIKEKPEYHDTMRAYQLVTLVAFPKVKEVRARMAFVDAPPKIEEPFKEPKSGVLHRRDLEDAKRAWEQKIEPMMGDTVFAPRPGYYCTWCPFRKSGGGPCAHG